MTGIKLWALLLLPCVAGCVPAPKTSYSTMELQKIDQLVEVMRVSYAEAKPIWGLEKKDALSEDDFGLLALKGERLEALFVALTGPLSQGRPEGFGTLARKIMDESKGLGAATAARDQAGVQARIKTLGDTCSACHKQYK